MRKLYTSMWADTSEPMAYSELLIQLLQLFMLCEMHGNWQISSIVLDMHALYDHTSCDYVHIISGGVEFIATA